MSKKYAKNKTGFTNGINDVMEIVYQNILFRDEYLKLEDISREWSKLHPDMYSAKIFYAETILKFTKGKNKDELSIDKITS